MFPRSPSAIMGRFRRIARTLRRRGLLRGFWWMRGPRAIDFSPAAAPRWREALEELGPTFVKFGQLLSLRADLLPPQVTAELAKLQDRTAPFPEAEARAAVAAALGGPVGELFASFDDRPLAAASIAQVHAATLADGRSVVVKVRRPGIRDSIDSDLAILQGLAGLVERVIPEARVHGPSALVEEFRRSILSELDFPAEARAMERFGAIFAGSPEVCIPRVVRERSGPGVLTAERIDGRRITDLAGVAQEERTRLARALVSCYLVQIFEHGIFHADPHPGNLVVLPDGRICLHDFGMVGRLSSSQRRAFAELFQGIFRRDADRLVDVVLRVGSPGEDVQRERLRDDIEQFVEEYAGLALADFSAGEVLERLVRLVRRHRIRMPTGFFLLGRTVVIVESVTRTLDPGYAVVPHLAERAADFVVRGLREVGADLRRVAEGGGDLLAALPAALAAAARTMRGGRFDLRLRHEKLEELESRLDRSFNRLTFGVVVAAIIVASSIIMQTRMPPLLLGVPVLGGLGFLTAAVLGFGLIIAIIRGGRL